jgi:hypothetical protein
MEEMITTKLFMIETDILLELELLDVNLDSHTTITLKDGRHTSFQLASGSVKLTTLNPIVDEELAHVLQEVLNGIARKVVGELMIVSKTEIGAAWKK